MYRLGYLKDLRNVDFTRVRKLVFVCTGNICRSPLGEYYARHLGVEAESYGLECRGGDPVDPRVVQLAEQMGINVSDHVTKHISHYRPSSDHLVVAMEPVQIDALPAGVGAKAQVTLAPLWLEQPTIYLHDPFTANSSYFNKCATDLQSALERIVENMNGQASN